MPIWEQTTRTRPTAFDRPVLLVDMDGVLADFDSYLWEQCSENPEITFDIKDPSESRHRYLADHAPKNQRGMVRRIVETIGFFGRLPVMEGAQESMELLRDTGIEIWVCTKPLESNPSCRDDKALWLRRHFPYLENQLIIAPDKSLVTGTVLLDDAPHPTSITRAHWDPVLFRSPWHAHTQSLADLFSWDWSDPIEDLLGRLSPS